MTSIHWRASEQSTVQPPPGATNGGWYITSLITTFWLRATELAASWVGVAVK
jgi:hypothetical protein